MASAGSSAQNNDDPAKASYPASYDSANIISVAAITRYGALATFSNYGLRTVHIAAPVTQSGAPIIRRPGYLEELSGTSMAAPPCLGCRRLGRRRGGG